MTKEQILKKLEEIVVTINSAHDEIAAGVVKDLSSMDQEVSKICAEIVKLSPEDAAQVQPVMADMISRLEGLAQSLQDFKSQFKQG